MGFPCVLTLPTSRMRGGKPPPVWHHSCQGSKPGARQRRANPSHGPPNRARCPDLSAPASRWQPEDPSPLTRPARHASRRNRFPLRHLRAPHSARPFVSHEIIQPFFCPGFSAVRQLRTFLLPRATLAADILALRHQFGVLHRSVRRPRLRQRDRIFWVWLSRLWTNWRSSLVMVKPDTVIRWHHDGFRLYWRWKSRKRSGRPKTEAEIRALIKRMAHENRIWGAPRIQSELLCSATRWPSRPSRSTCAGIANHRHRRGERASRTTYPTSRHPLLRRADGAFPNALLLPRASARPAARRSLQSRDPPNRSLDGPAGCRGVSVRRSTSLHDTRS